ncbi:MAG: hypothetical protein RSD14_04940 [Clostridia bacterium]
MMDKKNAIKEVQNEQLVAAMWSVSSLIDMKSQITVLEILEELDV